MNGNCCHVKSTVVPPAFLAPILWAVALRIAGLFDRVSRFLDDPIAGEPQKRNLPAPRPSDAPIAVLVIDASPSMEYTDWKPSRLQAAEDAAKAYVKRLKNGAPNTRVAVVAYHQHARTVCKLTPVERDDYLTKRIDGISTNSATNITAGLEGAHSILKKVNGKRQVVLLTDGEHNYGPKPHDVATELRKIAVLEIVGIGGSPADVDEKLLKSIASAYPDGRKRYHWIGDKEELVVHFEQLAGRLARS